MVICLMGDADRSMCALRASPSNEEGVVKHLVTVDYHRVNTQRLWNNMH